MAYRVALEGLPTYSLHGAIQTKPISTYWIERPPKP